jgi:alpha-L-arabinofuranosidase
MQVIGFACGARAVQNANSFIIVPFGDDSDMLLREHSGIAAPHNQRYFCVIVPD